MSMTNQKCRARPKIINVNTNDPVFYPYSIKVKINVVELVIISIISMVKFVFLVLLKKLT